MQQKMRQYSPLLYCSFSLSNSLHVSDWRSTWIAGVDCVSDKTRDLCHGRGRRVPAASTPIKTSYATATTLHPAPYTNTGRLFRLSASRIPELQYDHVSFPVEADSRNKRPVLV